MKIKKCIGKCQKPKEVSEDNFYKLSKNPDGFMNECKDCMIERKRKIYQEKKAEREFYAI